MTDVIGTIQVSGTTSEVVNQTTISGAPAIMPVTQPWVNGAPVSGGNPLPVVITSGGAPVAGTPLSMTLNWSGGVIVAAGTYLFTGNAAYPFTVNSLDASVGSAGGGFTAEVRAHGVDVGGLGAVVVNAAKTRTLSSGTNLSVVTGDVVDVILTAITGAPTNAFLTLNGVKS